MPGGSDDEYGAVARGRLKLKLPDSGVESQAKKSKKKKSKKAKKEKMAKEEAAALQSLMTKKDESGAAVDTRTAAERAHARVVEARMAEQLLKKAEKSHKERIMEFNTKLENSSEHFDIPKLSWTK